MIVLASKSPRRKMLMNSICDSFIVFDADIDEHLSYKLKDYKLICNDISLRKALKCQEFYKDDIIIAADTIVVINNQILGKPVDDVDAYNMLKTLSDNTHEVITSYTIIKGEKRITKAISSFVTFNKLNDELINSYIASGSPLDKAGAYGIQDNDKFNIIKRLEGSLNNVIGFPVEEIKNDLKLFIN